MVSVLVPTSFDLHNLDPPSHCGQKVEIPQRFFTVMKCVFRITIIPGSGSSCNNQLKRYSNGIFLLLCFILFYMLSMQRCEVVYLFIFANLFDQNLEGCQRGVGANISLFTSYDVVVFSLPFF